jgi:uncharacterized cupin superfamily protein
MTSWPNIVNVQNLEYAADANVPEAYQYEAAPAAFSQALGANKLGFNVSVLMPKKFSCPYHFHHSEEEVSLVLAGRAILRQPQGFREVSEGDLIVFGASADGAHQFYNHTEEPFRYLSLSTVDPLDVCEYPDSGKINVRALKRVFQGGAAVNYWKDEEDPAKYWPPDRL